MLLAPAASEYVNEREVRHFWSCEACGHELATSIDVLTQVELAPTRGGAAWKTSGTRALESAM